MAAKVIEYDAVGMSEISRCDRCGAHAYVEVNLPAGGKLRFCAHDADKNWEALVKIDGAAIYDHRPFLKAQEEPQPTPTK